MHQENTDESRNNYTYYTKQITKNEWKNFEWAYTKTDLLHVLKHMDTTNENSSALFHTGDLERRLEASNIRIDGLRELVKTKHGKARIREYIEESCIPDDEEEIEKTLFEMLHNIYLEFPSSSNFMERLVNDQRRGLADDEFKKESVRIAIVKQFVKHTEYNTAPIKKLVKEKLKEKYPDQKKFDDSMILAHIDESIFDVLEQIKKEEDRQKRKELNRKYHLLRLADDLATGKFRTNGTTRKDLYMFAFAFGMTSSFGNSDINYNYNTDIEKNLFQDFYNDNLLRYISKEYQENAKSFEAEPSGEGINYKNFTEVIYLYYLNQKYMTAKDKIRKSEELIKECIKEHKNNKSSDTGMHTVYFKNIYYKNQADNMELGDFKNFILNNFEFPDKKLSAAHITVNDEQRTAQDNLIKIFNMIQQESGDSDISAKTLIKECRIAVEDMIMDYQKDKNFVHLIRQLDRKLQIDDKLAIAKRNEENNKTGTKKETYTKLHVTRTDLIAAGFYYYQIKNISYNSNYRIISLQELYDDFCKFINPYLLKSRYQEINPKYIFDMYVIISLYQSVNFT